MKAASTCFPRVAGSVVALLMSLTMIGVLRQVAAEDEKWEVPIRIGADGWGLYENGRFGMLIPVPPGMVPQRPPDNGGGQAFQTPDGKVSLVVFGSFNVDNLGDLDVRWKDALAEPGRTITYKRKTERWFVVSGVTTEGTGFYERYEADSKYCAGWSLTYPQTEEKKYAPWVERIAKGFEARLGKGEDRLD